MNLFLLTAVPLAAVAVHRLWYPEHPAFQDWKVWVRGSVWSIAALVVVSFFGHLRAFTGDAWGAFVGLTVTDVILFPGAIVAAWLWTRPNRDPWELSLWLVLGFTMAGIRDFATTSRIDDLTELFLVPLDRILIILVLPKFLGRAWQFPVTKASGWWAAATAGLLWTGALVPVLSYIGWGWLVWAFLLGGLAAIFVPFPTKKKSRSLGSDPTITER